VLNFLVSVVRTGVPYLWGALVAWLTARGLGADVVAVIDDPQWQGAVSAALITVVTTAVYVVVRLIEQNLPRLLTRFLPDNVVDTVTKLLLVLLIGVPREPSYTKP
jgi:hypothetical protein